MLSSNNGANPEWADAVRDLTSGRGVDRIVEVGGPGTLAQSIKAATYGAKSPSSVRSLREVPTRTP